MFIRFTVENFLSFNRRTEFNMIASAEDRHKHHMLCANNDSLASLLRASIIYGANASGKSNLIRVMEFAKDFIVEGVEKNKNIGTIPFKLSNPDRLKEPSRFEFEFTCNGRQYAYGFVTNKRKVHEEWLFEVTLEKDDPIYERTGDDIKFNFSHSILQKIDDKEKARLGYEAESTRENLLFLTNTRERKIRHFDFAYKWFDDVLTIIFPHSRVATLPLLIRTEERRFGELLRPFDLGIERLSIREILFDDCKDIVYDKTGGRLDENRSIKDCIEALLIKKRPKKCKELFVHIHTNNNYSSQLYDKLTEFIHIRKAIESARRLGGCSPKDPQYPHKIGTELYKLMSKLLPL